MHTHMRSTGVHVHRCEHLVPHWRKQRGEGRARQDAGDEGDGPRCHRVGTLCRGEAPVRAPPPRSERASRGKRQKKGAFTARRGAKKEKKGARIRTSLAAPPPGSYGRPVRYQSTSFCSNDSLGSPRCAQTEDLPCVWSCPSKNTRYQNKRQKRARCLTEGATPGSARRCLPVCLTRNEASFSLQVSHLCARSRAAPVPGKKRQHGRASRLDRHVVSALATAHSGWPWLACRFASRQHAPSSPIRGRARGQGSRPW